jgi:competence protein ComEC
VVSLIVTPLALAAAVLPFDAVAALAHWVMDWLMAYLAWLNSFDWAVWQRAEPPLWAVLLAILGALWCLIPWPLPWRVQGMVWMMPLVLLPAPQPAAGDLWLTVLDVGQGLAVVARTANHTLLVDAGPRYSPDADSGNRVVVPFLRGSGVNRLDGMVITHDDIDHSGGAQSVLRAVPTGWLATSLAPEHPVRLDAPQSRNCAAGETWEWDGVRFEVLHPQVADYAAASAKRDNAMSCVMRVVAHGRSILLTADIEADVEATLTTTGAGLASDILVAPHHGSKTSSTPAFLDAVKPNLIVIPVGYRNRFRHPAPDVMERYRQSGARLLRTDRDGAVTLRFGTSGIDAHAYRTQRARYWHAR